MFGILLPPRPLLVHGLFGVLPLMFKFLYQLPLLNPLTGLFLFQYSCLRLIAMGTSASMLVAYV